MPLITRHSVLATKAETSPGTAIALSGSDTVYVSELKITADIQQTERPDDGSLGQRTAVIGGKKGKIEFKHEFKGSGTPGTSPAWALKLLPCCGLKENTGTWKPSSLQSDWKQNTFGVYRDGLRYTLFGAMANLTIEGEHGKPLYCKYSVEGVWANPVDAAVPTPESDTVKPSPFIGAHFVLGTQDEYSSGTAPVTKFSLDVGNTLYVREDASAPSGSGYFCTLITARKPMITIDPEATLVATWNPFSLFTSQTELSQSLTLQDGLIIAAPKAQFTEITPGDRSGLAIHDAKLSCNRNSGDDEFSISF